MKSELGIEMRTDFDVVALEAIAKAAAVRAHWLRKEGERPFAVDDAKRFDDLASAIRAVLA